MTANDVALADALVAFGLLAALQRLQTWLKVRSRAVRRILDAEPTLLDFRDEFLNAALRKSGLTRADLHEVARRHGVGSFDDIAAIVLEPWGSFSVVEADGASGEPASTLSRIET